MKTDSFFVYPFDATNVIMCFDSSIPSEGNIEQCAKKGLFITNLQ